MHLSNQACKMLHKLRLYIFSIFYAKAKLFRRFYKNFGLV